MAKQNFTFPQVGETISAEQLGSLPDVGETIDTDQFNRLSSPNQPEQKESGLKTASRITDSIFGGGVLGEAIGGSIAGIGALARGDKEAFRTIAQDQPTALQVAGDLLKIGTTLGSAVLPPTKAASFVPAVVKGGLVGAGQGTALGTSQALREGETKHGEIARAAIEGGTIGGLVGGAFSGFSFAVSASAKKFMDSALKWSKKLEKLEIDADDARSATRTLQKHNIFGTAKGMLNTVNKNKKITENKVNQIIANNSQKFSTRNVLQDSVRRTVSEFDGNLTDDAVMRIYKNPNLPFKKILADGNLTVKEANKLRSLIDNKFIGNAKWLASSPDPLRVVVLKNTAHTLRNLVKSTDDQLPILFDDLAGYHSAHGLLLDTIASKRSLPRLLVENGLLVGGVASLASGADPRFAASMGVIVGGTELFGSTLFKSTASVTSNVLSKALQTLPEQFTKEQLIRAILEKENETN